ncbi:hypothetical protein [Micromonospora endolithica]|uniref:hypothetical protein n=1 Tax=Micromonospora endolithica TaxID=230091 RepID=UPI0011AD877B|nr:hypothetical protein [Micromonospora endolithica]TWJ20185.1 hypothetical protein JD76_00280 [Micromonospora endolithica]
MGRIARMAGGTVASAVDALAARARRAGRGTTGNDPGGGRWQVVTVDRTPDEVRPDGRWPEPLRRLGDAVQVRVRPAPGCRGTELAARPRPGRVPPGLAAHLVGDDPGAPVRAALRQAKQLAETGEVLRADRPAMDRAGPPG